MPQFSRGRIFKVLFSLFALYQIFVMTVMPNLSSYLGRSAQSSISNYASAVGLNAGWNFFSPDPAHTMYIKYSIHYDDPNADAETAADAKPSVEGFFPAEGRKGIEDFTRHREALVMRFMVIYPKRMQYLLGPWLCRQYPGSTYLDLEHVIETVPSLDESVAFTDQDVRDLSKQVQVVQTSFTCGGESLDEVEFL